MWRLFVLIAAVIGLWWLFKHWGRVSRKLRGALAAAGVPIAVQPSINSQYPTQSSASGGPDKVPGCGSTEGGCS